MEPVEECHVCHKPVSLHDGGIQCKNKTVIIQIIHDSYGNIIRVPFNPSPITPRPADLDFLWLFKLDYNQSEYQSEQVGFNGRQFSFTGRLRSETREMRVYLQCHNQEEQKEEATVQVWIVNSSCHTSTLVGPVWHGPNGFRHCTKRILPIIHTDSILEADTSFIMPQDTRFRIRIKCTFSCY